jgi:hypothetical protein
MFFDPMYFWFVAPAFLLGLWAQLRIQLTYAAAQQQPSPLSTCPRTIPCFAWFGGEWCNSIEDRRRGG